MKLPIKIKINMIQAHIMIQSQEKKELEWEKLQQQKLSGQLRKMKSLLDQLKFMVINLGTDFVNLCLIKQKSDVLKDGFS